MWATRLIAGFGAVGLAGAPLLLRASWGQCASREHGAALQKPSCRHASSVPLPARSPRDSAPDLGVQQPGLHRHGHRHAGGWAHAAWDLVARVARSASQPLFSTRHVRGASERPTRLPTSPACSPALPPPLPPPFRTQSLVAFHLGKADRRSAAAVFRRTLSLALFAGVAIMCGLLAAKSSLPAVFTPDAAVVRQVELVRRALAWHGHARDGCRACLH